MYVFLFIDNIWYRLMKAATLKNGTIYVDGGTEVFVANNNQGAPEGVETIGYSS